MIALRAMAVAGLLFQRDEAVSKTVGSNQHSRRRLVASHTLNHAQLPELIESNLGAAQAEVVESRAILEREIDGVDFIAYPGGRFDPAAQALVHDAGYRLAVSTVPGIVHTSARRFELRRVAVQAWWPVARVRDAIRAAALVDGVDSPV